MHTELRVRISDYFSYDADKKWLEKVSNLVKLSLFYRAYKYELAYLNKQSLLNISLCLLQSVQHLKFNVTFATKHYSAAQLSFICKVLHISNSIEEIVQQKMQSKHYVWKATYM